MFECDTLFPVIGRFPVTWQTRDMGSSLNTSKKLAALYTLIPVFMQVFSEKIRPCLRLAQPVFGEAERREAKLLLFAVGASQKQTQTTPLSAGSETGAVSP
jgi:hypothetical protein